MLKSMRRVAGKLVEVLTGRTFLMMAGWALVSSAVSYASTSTTGLPWETPLQTVKQSLTGPVAAGILVVGIAAGGALLAENEVFAIARKALTDLVTVSLEERIEKVFARRLRELNPKAKELLGAAIENSSQPALIRSAFNLPADQRTAIHNALN